MARRLLAADRGRKVEARAVSDADVASVKRSLLDGKPTAAAAHYARAADIPREAAALALATLGLPARGQALRHVPLTRFGLLLGAGGLTLALATTGWALARVIAGSGADALVLALGAFVSTRLALWFAPKVAV